jgi:hypothetical protein
MKKMTILTIAVALLSGCALSPRYSVAKGSDGWGHMRWKNKVDLELAEDGREWRKGWPKPELGECIVRRERSGKFLGDPPPDYQQYKEDVNCSVWTRTEGRERKLDIRF